MWRGVWNIQLVSPLLLLLDSLFIAYIYTQRCGNGIVTSNDCLDMAEDGAVIAK